MNDGGNEKEVLEKVLVDWARKKTKLTSEGGEREETMQYLFQNSDDDMCVCIFIHLKNTYIHSELQLFSLPLTLSNLL